MKQDKEINNKAQCVFERLFNSKTPKGISEYIKNWRNQAEMKKKLEEEAEQTHIAPEFVEDHIYCLKH